MSVQTIELTSKSWKKVQLTGGLLALAGFFGVIIGGEMHAAVIAVPAVLAMPIGGCVWLYGRIGAWWHHG
jgi:hypothetical protein